MMNLKEACRYAKFLNDTINQIARDFRFGYMNGAIYEIREDHLRSKKNENAEDEMDVVVELNQKYDIEVENLTELMQALVLEKTILSNKIAKAKEKLYIEWEEGGEKLSVDTAVEHAKNTRLLCENILNTLKVAKEKETKTSGTDYMKNVEGNQVSYRYDVVRKETLKFDKKNAIELGKKLLTKADKISELVDEANTQRIIDFEPNFNLHDNIDELIANYLDEK